MIRDSAISYAERGWACFPCRSGGKVPLTPNGLHAATTDTQQILRWWAQHPRANIGVRTGRESGLVVLDVDGDDGAETLRRLELANNRLPVTASVKTPRGGAHYYFAHPATTEIRCSAGVLGAGLDVRADGGYVIAPPSVGNNGAYEVDEDTAPASLPPWLADLLVPVTPNGEAEPAETWITMVRDGFTEGQRNSSLARIVGHMLRRDLDARLALELAMLINNARCRPPLTDREVQRIVQSIAERELMRRFGPETKP